MSCIHALGLRPEPHAVRVADAVDIVVVAQVHLGMLKNVTKEFSRWAAKLG